MKEVAIMDITKEFAKALYNRRKQLGLTQDEVADRVGTSKQMVSMYELGKRSPKVGMANRFAEALGTTLDELLGLEGELESFTSEPKTEEARILANGIDKLPKEQRERALAMFRVMFEPQYANLFKKGTDEQ